jgi:hypothetical protein
MCICTSVGWLRYTTIRYYAYTIGNTTTHASCHVYIIRFYNYINYCIFTITTIVLVKHTRQPLTITIMLVI